jgi:C4-dicarboxylate transporter DctM subunit
LALFIIVNLAIGLIAPPVGPGLCAARGIAKISLEDIFKAVWPFLAATIAALMAISHVPGLSPWPPGLLGYR